jgi:hypothetical protein
VVAPLYFFLNTGLVAAAIGVSTHQPIAKVWSRNFIWSAPSYLTGAALAAVATVASARGWSGWLALLAIPLYLVFRSYHSVVGRLREEQDQTHRAMEVQLATIEALALAIEAKAGCTPEHIRQIQQYAAMLSEAAGLSDEDVQAVRTAALLHDIGNMAVPEHILAKPDALTPKSSSGSRSTRASARTFFAGFHSPARLPISPATTSAGTGSGILLALAVTTSRSARASWPLPIASARCRPIGPTGRREARRPRSRCCANSPALPSILNWSICSSRASAARRRPTRRRSIRASGRSPSRWRCATSPARTVKRRRCTRSRSRSVRASA